MRIARNRFEPTLVNADPNGLTSRNPDLEFAAFLEAERNFSSRMKRHAYERLADSSLARSNPPFDYGSAGRLTSMVEENRSGNDPRILRGYVRRSNLNAADPTAGYRMYFMYNPAVVQRNYVAYLEQQALDPFNTIYGSDNLVAPPGILDFQFDLMYDRQTENANGTVPRGVLVDHDYFDLVIRGLVPGSGPQLQDNGIMMINPRNITVVFSPQLSVQGRPYRAKIRYEKFDHNMTPVRMTVTLSMKVFYFGPVRTDLQFSQSRDEGRYRATIPYDESVKYTVTAEEVKFAKLQLAGFPGLTGGDGEYASGQVGGVIGAASGPNAEIRMRALKKAMSLGDGQVKYWWGGRTLSPGMDCSGLVSWAYTEVGAVEAIGGSGSTYSIYQAAERMGTCVVRRRSLTPNDLAALQPGDLLLSDRSGGIDDHVAFVVSYDGSRVHTYESRPDGKGKYGGRGPANDFHTNHKYAAWYNYIIRPAVAGNDSVVNI
jgi:cell wall-associated NlpC family hydrolase